MDCIATLLAGIGVPGFCLYDHQTDMPHVEGGCIIIKYCDVTYSLITR